MAPWPLRGSDLQMGLGRHCSGKPIATTDLWLGLGRRSVALGGRWRLALGGAGAKLPHDDPKSAAARLGKRREHAR